MTFDEIQSIGNSQQPMDETIDKGELQSWMRAKNHSFAGCFVTASWLRLPSSCFLHDVANYQIACLRSFIWWFVALASLGLGIGLLLIDDCKRNLLYLCVHPSFCSRHGACILGDQERDG